MKNRNSKEKMRQYVYNNYYSKLKEEGDMITTRNYFHSIGEDDLFRDNYTLQGLTLPRKVIVFMLYHKMYGLLELLMKNMSD
jgi:hypothetical protein